MKIPDSLKPHFIETRHCPLCDNEHRQKIFTVNSLTFYECKSCRFRFMNPHLSSEGMGILYQNSEVLTEVNPALEKYYEYNISGKRNQTRSDYLEVLNYANKIIRTFGSARNLFEVGYGNGGFLLEAQQIGWHVNGIDTSTQNHLYLSDHHQINLHCGPFDDFEEEKNKYHMVALWDVIEHTTNPKLFVQKAYEMLCPGGLLVLATPNIGGLLNFVSEAIYFLSGKHLSAAIKQLYVLEHVGYYNSKTLRKLVVSQGFIPKKEILTQTDLERYEFSPKLRLALSCFFFVAKVLMRQNRIILMAQKI